MLQKFVIGKLTAKLQILKMNIHFQDPENRLICKKK